MKKGSKQEIETRKGKTKETRKGKTKKTRDRNRKKETRERNGKQEKGNKRKKEGVSHPREVRGKSTGKAREGQKGAPWKKRPLFTKFCYEKAKPFPQQKSP